MSSQELFNGKAEDRMWRCAFQVADRHFCKKVLEVRGDRFRVSLTPPKQLPLLLGQIIHDSIAVYMESLEIGMHESGEPYAWWYGPMVVSGRKVTNNPLPAHGGMPPPAGDIPSIFRFLVSRAHLDLNLPLQGSVRIGYGRRKGLLQFKQLSIRSFQLKWDEEWVWETAQAKGDLSD